MFQMIVVVPLVVPVGQAAVATPEIVSVSPVPIFVPAPESNW
jgi:hypothetical protein